MTLDREPDRLASLRSYRTSDPGRIDRLDALARLAAAAFGALPLEINLVEQDAVLTKGAANSERTITPIDRMLCTVVARTGQELILPDTGSVARLEVPGMTLDLLPGRAYAGVPLVGRDGLALGAVCVYHEGPRPFSSGEVDALRTAARQVMTYLELRRLDGWTLSAEPDDTIEDSAHGIRQALELGQLTTHFQPVVDLRTGRYHSIEALLRWYHPEEGLVLPGRFIPVIENTALVHPVGREVLRQALAQVQTSRHLLPGLSVAVNVSPRQISEPGFADSIATQLERYELNPSVLTLEITETTELKGRSAIRQLTQLRDLGVSISLDDYGAGYSSLLRVLELPITALKIDRRLVRQLPKNARVAAAVRSTIQLCDDLGLDTVAEGVETADQLAAVCGLAVSHAQGYLLARPVPGEQLTAVLTAERLLAEPGPVDPPGWSRDRQTSHTVHYYEDEDELLSSVVSFLHRAAAAGRNLLVVTSRARRERIEQHLVLRGLDLTAAAWRGRYLALDRQKLVDTCLSDNLADDAINELVETTLSGMASARHTAIYGDAVEVLWAQGALAQALRLEQLWDNAAQRHRLSIYCAYGAGMTDTRARVALSHCHATPTPMAPQRKTAAVAEPDLDAVQE